jgi:23S rRNA (guanosine2251-2'-O)-methyltransferase
MSRLFGINALADLDRIAPHAITRLLLADQAGHAEVRFAEKLRSRGVPVDRVKADALQERSGARGGAQLAGEIALARPVGLDALAPSMGHDRAVIALDQVSDPHNLGAILRTAAAFGACAVVVPRNGSAPLTDAAVRASAGAAALVPVERVTNLSRAIRELEELGFWTAAITGEAETELWATDFKAMSWAFVLGAEGAGLRPNVARTCRTRIRIECGGPLSTLNVGVACAVTLAEYRRQNRPSL